MPTTIEDAVRVLTLFTETVMSQVEALQPGALNLLLNDPAARAGVIDRCGKTMQDILKAHDGKPIKGTTRKAIDKLAQDILDDLLKAQKVE